MIGVGHDFRAGARALTRRPGLVLVCVVTLAIGLGGATTMFAALGAVMTAALPPIPEPDRVARLWGVDARSGLDRLPLGRAEFLALAGRVTTLEALAAFNDAPGAVRVGNDTYRASIVQASDRYLAVMDVAPTRGRWISQRSNRGGANREIVASEAFCARVFGEHQDVLGRVVIVDGLPRTIVGVLSAAFGFPSRGTELWLALDLGTAGDVQVDQSLYAVGRLRAGVTWEQAQAEVAAISESLTERPDLHNYRTVRVVPVRQEASKRLGLGLAMLMGPALLLLLVACANVAILLLVRAAERRSEIAVRAVLGAGLWRLVRGLVAESVTLALVSGGLGLVLAYWGVAAFRELFSGVSPELAADMVMDGRTLGFALGVTLAAPCIFGLAPAVHAARADLYAAIRNGSAHHGARRGSYGLSDLVVCLEVAMAVILVVVSGMLVRFFWELNHLDPGFDVEHVITLQLQTTDAGPTSGERALAFYEQAAECVGAVPGVRHASFASTAVVWAVGPGRGERVEVEPNQHESADRSFLASTSAVSEGYFTTLGNSLLRGRAFGGADTKRAPRVAIISETAGRRFWPGLDPIGRRIKVGSSPDPSAWIEVVGVVHDVMTSSRLPARPAVYLPFGQAGGGTASLVVRTTGSPLDVLPDVRRALLAMDPELTAEATRVGDEVSRLNAGARITVGSIALFGLLTIVLATVGLFSVISRTVARRTRDIGVHLALGARPYQLIPLVAARYLALLLVGFAGGAIGTLAVTRLVWPELVTVSSTDPVMWLGLLAVLIAIGLLASTAPARRAMRVDPIVALRHE